MALHLRSEWTTARPNFSPARKGVNFVVIHHTAGQAQGDVPAILRGIESMVTHKAPGNTQPLIATDYNLLVDPTGGIWEGRGLQNEDAATLAFNAQSVSICAIGNYDVNQPPPALLTGIAYATQIAIAGGWVTPHPVIEGHRDVGTFSTACPGRYLEAQLPKIRALVYGAPQSDPAPAPTPKDEAMYLVLQGSVKNDLWFTNFLTKRKVIGVEEAGLLIKSGATNGAKVTPYPQQYVDSIPVVK